MGFVWEESGYQSDTEHYADNIYASSVWDKMADAGAVFLPCAGWRNGKSTTETLWYGDYWSVSSGEESAAYFLRFRGDILNPQYGYNRYRGRSIRLVKDEPQPEPESMFTPKPFSVSDAQQITFSPGNLQYNAAKGTHLCADGTTQQGTWRFAEHQWDIAGMGYGQTNKDNHCYIGGTVQNGDNRNISETYDGWTDLFGWGTSGWNSGAAACQPWATSVTNSDYHPGGSDENNLTGNCANADWGVYNRIGDDGPGTWRTLTYDEWNYLINTRTNAGSKYGVAGVNGMTGVVILPDDFTLPADCGFTPGMTKADNWYDWSYVATTNIYTSAQWQLMEAAGAVFLPCAGDRNRALVFGAGAAGRYWSSTANNSDNAYYLSFSSDGLHTYANYRYRGFSVRLVKDQTPPPPPSAYNPQPFSISADRQILFSPGNLQYNAAQGTHQCADGTTQQGTWRFAEHQWDFVGDGEVGNVYDNGKKCDNALVGNDYDGWIDIFGWGTSGWNSGANEYYPWALSEDNADYIPGGDVNNDLTDSYAYADWSVYNEIGGDAPETWRTLSKDEWVYLFRERENAEKLFAMGTVNGVGGTIILPDEWVTPVGLTFTPSTGKGFIWEDDTHFSGGNKHYSDNIYTLAQWQQMESAGAVFLPAAGCRAEEELQRANGRYWSSTHASTNGSYYLRFAADYLYTHFYYNRKRGFSIRPVKDAVTDPNLP